MTRAAPIKPGKYDAVRCGAVLVGTLLLCFCGAGLCMAFYALLFGWYDFLSLLAPAVLVWGPVILFCLGAGLTEVLVGQIGIRPIQFLPEQVRQNPVHRLLAAHQPFRLQKMKLILPPKISPTVKRAAVRRRL